MRRCAAVLVGHGRARLVALGTLGVVVASVVLAVALPWTTAASTGTVTVAVVQGDVPGPGNDILYDFRQVTENHAQATVDLADDVAAGRVPAPDFVLWPENSTAIDPFRDGATQARIRRATEAIGVPVLVGRHRRRRPRGGAEPGDRVGPGDRGGRALHQAAPGGLRRVHPVPLGGGASTSASSPGSAGTCWPAPDGTP